MSRSLLKINDGDEYHSHLNDDARSALNLSEKERIASIYALKHAWIPYDGIKEVFDSAEELLARPQDPRLPCILLFGDPDSGKTASLREYQKRHPIDPNPTGDHKIAPVIYVEIKGPDILAFYASILDFLGAKWKPGDRVDKRRYQAVTVLPKVEARQLLLDELNTAIAGPLQRQKDFLVELKYLLNVVNLTAFAAGTGDARSALAVDPQMESRFVMKELPRWKNGIEWHRLLKSFERRIPLPKPSFLFRPSFAEKLHKMTEGSLGELAELLMAAAVLALKSKKEKIDDEVLEKLHWQPPSIRRARARDLAPR